MKLNYVTWCIMRPRGIWRQLLCNPPQTLTKNVPGLQIRRFYLNPPSQFSSQFKGMTLIGQYRLTLSLSVIGQTGIVDLVIYQMVLWLLFLAYVGQLFSHWSILICICFSIISVGILFSSREWSNCLHSSQLVKSVCGISFCLWFVKELWINLSSFDWSDVYPAWLRIRQWLVRIVFRICLWADRTLP